MQNRHFVRPKVAVPFALGNRPLPVMTAMSELSSLCHGTWHGQEMSGNNLKVSGIINLPSLGSLSGGKLLCPEQYIEGFASVPVGIVENRPRVPLLNSIEPSIGWSHPLTKKGDACSLPTWQANLVEEPSNT